MNGPPKDLSQKNPKFEFFMVDKFSNISFLSFVCLLICQRVTAASLTAADERPEKVVADASTTQAKKPYWSDPLKNIPVGPYELDISGSVRLRFEHSDDFNIQRYADQRRPTLSRDGFLLHRSRLDFNLRFSEHANFYTQFQDARLYDSDLAKSDFTLGCPYWNSFGLRQAYLEWRQINNTAFGVKLGRQSIFYGDNRIWGPGEWGNVGRYTWDAVKLIAEAKSAEVHFLFARRVTYDDGVYRTFDGAFGAVDKMYGRMNLFSWMNIHDFQLSCGLKPTERTTASVDWHWFYLDEAKDAWYYCNGRPQRRDPTGQAGSAVGQEIDLVVSHKYSDHLKFQAGYAHFFPGGFLKDTGPSPDADWVFFQTLYSF